MWYEMASFEEYVKRKVGYVTDLELEKVRDIVLSELWRRAK
jgi:hypothetical protein